MDCLGEYEPSDKCDKCQAVYLCIDVAQENDGYWDQLAEREEALWELMESGAECAARRDPSSAGS